MHDGDARQPVLRPHHGPANVLGRRATPCVEAPIGDFFGIGHGIVKDFWSLPLSMSPQDGRGFNCFFPMPFASRARIEVDERVGRGDDLLLLRRLRGARPSSTRELGRFHAQWRRENPTQGWAEGRYDDNSMAGQFGELRKKVWSTPNLDGKDNYVILEAEGRGHYVGCNLNIDCFSRQANDWYGEGDDMIFIDGEAWPPSPARHRHRGLLQHGVLPRGQEFCAPYHGVTVYSGTEDWPWKRQELALPLPHRGPGACSRSRSASPSSTGTPTSLSNDYSSTAYWYQAEPHAPFPALPPAAERLPRPDAP